VQPDGKIVVVGKFTALCGQSRSNIGRLNPNGSLDTAFNPGAIGESAIAVALQTDGKIVVGGNFNTLGSAGRAFIGRLNPNGSLDTTFNPGTNDTVRTLALQPDGKILYCPSSIDTTF